MHFGPRRQETSANIAKNKNKIVKRKLFLQNLVDIGQIFGVLDKRACFQCRFLNSFSHLRELCRCFFEAKTSENTYKHKENMIPVLKHL